MIRLGLLLLVACGNSAPTDAEKACRRDRVGVVQQLDLAEKQLSRVAIQNLPVPATEVDNDIGRIQSAESKVMVEAYTKRRELVASLREAVGLAAGAWKGIDDPTATTAVLLDKLATFDRSLDPVQARFELSKREGAAVIASLETKRSDPNQDQAALTRELRTARTHGQVAELWLSTHRLDVGTFTPLRRAIETATATCAKR